jgi:hypothetical protein
MGGNDESEVVADFDFKSLEIVDSLVELENDAQPFGAILGASLTMIGSLISLNFEYNRRQEPTSARQIDDGMRRLLTDDGTVVGAIYPDILTELQFVDRISCLIIRAEPFYSEVDIPYEINTKTYGKPEDMAPEDTMVMGLALLKVPNEHNTYRRVGLVRWLKKHSLPLLYPSTITII